MFLSLTIIFIIPFIHLSLCSLCSILLSSFFLFGRYSYINLFELFRSVASTNCLLICVQFYDLLNIFELNGLPSEENPYLFNGDFVDRGSFSLEVILTLFAFKCMCPSGEPTWMTSFALSWSSTFCLIYLLWTIFVWLYGQKCYFSTTCDLGLVISHPCSGVLIFKAFFPFLFLPEISLKWMFDWGCFTPFLP